MRLEGMGALITGASRGLGAALAEALARRGARIGVVARDAAAVEEVAARIRHSGGVAHGFAADVSDKEAIYPLAGAASALLGPIDLLVHNASTLGVVPLEYLLDTDCEALEDALATNVVGPFRLTKALVGGMAVRRRGLILHVSSDASVNAYPRWGAYGTSKAALDHLARHWDTELEGTGVRSLSVDPGEMDTWMHAQAAPEADRSTLLQPGEVAARLVRLIEAISDVPRAARLEAAAYAGEAP